MLDHDDLIRIRDEVFPEWVRELAPEPVEIGATRCVFRVAHQPRFARPDGVMSGQALSAIADTCMVLTLAAHFGSFRPVATVDLSMSFMRAIRDSDTLCAVEIVRAGRTVAFLRATLGTDLDQPGAMGSASFLLPPA